MKNIKRTRDTNSQSLYDTSVLSQTDKVSKLTQHTQHIQHHLQVQQTQRGQTAKHSWWWKCLSAFSKTVDWKAAEVRERGTATGAAPSAGRLLVAAAVTEGSLCFRRWPPSQSTSGSKSNWALCTCEKTWKDESQEAGCTLLLTQSTLLFISCKCLFWVISIL